MKIMSLFDDVASNSYPGRGIVIGKSKDGSKAVVAYFIMGRSSNSRNRIFVEDGEGIRTQAFDPSKLEDPSLIIYSPVRVLGNSTIVTNGDQTDTVYDLMGDGKTFEQALLTREFEPDGPNYTPRISGIMEINHGSYGLFLQESLSQMVLITHLEYQVSWRSIMVHMISLCLYLRVHVAIQVHATDILLIILILLMAKEDSYTLI